ncbi:MAG TPA: DUF5602 domain-containing protein [Candidatus Limnocylindria bacterium]|jgi:hypothetical protein|nr:DUF5602 domain-containing protein [Candidatus Limnocylindria bacterium]
MGWKSITVAVLTAAGFVASGPAQAAPPAGTPATTQLGDRKPLGDGYAQSWVRRDASGKVVAFGISFDETSLANLGEKPTEVVLALPASAELPFKTAVVDWNPQGHPPAHVYDLPHFDFHFYTIDEPTRRAIAPSGAAASATPAPDIVPVGFVTDGETVPMMGKHYIAGSVPEFHGGKFTATPIYGYYGGHLVFLESMVTVDSLSAKHAISAALPQPARFEKPGTYPAQWSIGYDATARRYEIAFGGLTPHV